MRRRKLGHRKVEGRLGAFCRVYREVSTFPAPDQKVSLKLLARTFLREVRHHSEIVQCKMDLRELKSHGICVFSFRFLKRDCASPKSLRHLPVYCHLSHRIQTLA